MEINEIKPIIDALIFASESPLSTARIKQIFDETNPEEVSTKDIKEAINALNSDNREQQRGYFLQEVAGGYQYRTRPNYSLWVKKLKKIKPFRLTLSTMETLAIIAYNQPIIRAEIDKIRGVDSGGVVKNLLERNLIKIMGRQNIPGRPFLLGTTKRFLEVFGLEKLSDMPSLKDFDNLDESKLPTILKNKLSDRLQEDKTQLFEVSDEDESEEQNEIAAADSETNNNPEELPADHENIPDENTQQLSEPSELVEEESIPKIES
jgi:segregation and condensation protein B